MAGLNILAWQINPSRFAIQPCWRCGTENGGLLLSACFKQAFTSNPTSLGRTDTGEALPCLVTDQPALAHWPCRNFRFALTIVQPKNHGSQHSHTSDVCPDMTQTTQWPAFHALCVRSSQLDQLQTANSCEFSRLDKVRDLVKITRLVHPTMPGNLDSPGSLDMPGCLWRQCQLAKTPTTWSGRAQRRTPKARPQGEAAQTMPSTQSATARPSRKHRSNTSGLQNEPFRNHPDTLPTQNRTKEIHPTTNFSCQVAQHRYGAVYASPQIWTCLRLPTDMDLSMPPRRYGPVYASPQIWACLSLPTDMDLSMPPHRYGPVHASPQIWACLCLSTDMGLSMPPHRYWSVCASP